MWQALAGGFIGKILGKISEWVPSREQYSRSKVEKLERERDEITQAGIPNNKRKRLDAILQQLREAEAFLKNR